MNKNNFPKLGPIIIGTSNIEKAKDFYVKVFGIKIENESPNYVSARGVDGTHIELEEDSENRFPNWEKHNIGTYKNSEFSVDEISSFLDSVEQNGGKIISEPKERPWGGYGAEISDPEGNMFLISQK
jgi:lactoylglutathione lyase